MVLIIDHDDSFTYNLVQAFGQTGQSVTVKQHNKVTIKEIEALAPRYLVFSSGSRSLGKEGITVEAIRHFAGKIPMLGVSLGHQLIVEAFGGNVMESGKYMYGKTSSIHHDEQTIFTGMEQAFSAARYDSFIVDKAMLPDCLLVSAETEAGEVMGIRHKTAPIEGVQFHPESMMTVAGQQLLQNFITVYGG